VKILWHSNAPWANTGYGKQTAIALEELKELGHEMVVSAFYGIQGATLNAPGGFLVLPSHIDSYGNDIASAHWKFTESDLVISLVDAWVLNDESWGKMPWAAWTPIDHDPAPTHVTDVLEKGNAVPIAMSRFGERAMREAGLDPLYVPHSVHPTFLEDMPDRHDIRKGYKWDDNFVVGMVAANKGHHPSRKSFTQVFEAFETFYRAHPEALLYLHCEQDPPFGIDLPTALDRFGIPQEAALFVDTYRNIVGMGEGYMRNTFAAFDVLANPSMGEGFGVPIIEAQAVGTPVIVSDWTAMPELCHYGKAVGGTRTYTDQSTYQITPNVGEIYEAMEWAYKTPRESDSRDWVRENYSPSVVTEKYWVPTLEAIMERMKDREFDYE
jgi:hypothetical protein